MPKLFCTICGDSVFWDQDNGGWQHANIHAEHAVTFEPQRGETPVAENFFDHVGSMDGPYKRRPGKKHRAKIIEVVDTAMRELGFK